MKNPTQYAIVSKANVLKNRCTKRKREYFHVLQSLFRIRSKKRIANEGGRAVTIASGKAIVASNESWYSSAR
jgi:hypothetical protein